MLREHLEAIQRVCFELTPAGDDLETLGSPERWQIYRRMVRARLVGVIQAAIPRTQTALGEDALTSHIDRWLAEAGPQTRYFYEVPVEFARFTMATLEKHEPPWVADLARYEIACWAVKHGPGEHPPVTSFSFERRPVMNPALQVLRLSYTVHEKPTPAEGYASAETRLCVYRDKTHGSSTWTLNPMAADLVEAWMVGESPVAESVRLVASRHGSAITESFIEKLSEMIANFIDRGMLFGSRA